MLRSTASNWIRHTAAPPWCAGRDLGARALRRQRFRDRDASARTGYLRAARADASLLRAAGPGQA